MSSRSEPAVFKPDSTPVIGPRAAGDDLPPRVSPVDPILAALERHRGEDAVRLFLNALARHVGGAVELIDVLRDRGGEPAVHRLVSAFAKFPCPHCRRGFSICPACSGKGHGEDPRGACQPCVSLGVVACDFCGGCGVATYSFIPEPLCPAVAAARADSAARRIAGYLSEPLPAEAAREQLFALRKVLAKRLVELRRELAVLANAAQFARDRRAADPGGARASTGRLFAFAARNARPARAHVSSLLRVLSRISRELASAAQDPSDSGFEIERAESFEAEANREAQAALHRSALITGR